jgi:hypothetical protein
VTQSVNLAICISRFVVGSQAQWQDLVDIACSISAERIDKAAGVLAARARTGKETVLRKMHAIQFLQAKGLEADAIKAIGQAKALSDFTKAKKAERTEDLVMMKFYVSPDFKDRFTTQLWHVGKVLKRKTSEEVLDFCLSLMTVPDEEIRHLAGEGDAPKKKAKTAEAKD